MSEHQLLLKYDGRLASASKMDASDIHHAYEGAKRLLALHGYVYAVGKVPRNKVSSTQFFRVTACAPRAGSVVLELGIGIAGSAIWDVTKYSFREYFVPAVQNFLRGQTVSEPEYARIEPTLTPLDRGNSPFISLEHERKALDNDLHAGDRKSVV